MPNRVPTNDCWPFQMLKAALWIYLIFGVTGLGQFMHLGYDSEIEIIRNRDYEEVARQSRQMHEKQLELLAAAEASGTNYTPEDYFRDLRTIHELWYKSPQAVTTPEMFELQHLAMENVRLGYCSDRNVERLSAEFSTWNQQARTQDDFDAMEAQIVAAGGWKAAGRWAWRVYLASIPFVLLLYWLRLFCDQGVIATILDDKRRFLLAVLLWPVFIWLYPGDRSIRAIVVEAQLRRYGALFRKLTLAERRMVQRARQQSLILSLKQVRQFTRRQPCRLFVLGLLATVICAMAASMAGRDLPAPRAGPPLMAAADVGWSQSTTADSLTSVVSADLPLAPAEVGDSGPSVPVRRMSLRLVSMFLPPLAPVPKSSLVTSCA